MGPATGGLMAHDDHLLRCTICGSDAHIQRDGVPLCPAHDESYSVFRCQGSGCGQLVTLLGAAPPDLVCSSCRLQRRLAGLAREDLAPIDREIEQGMMIKAIILFRNLLGLSVGDAQHAAYLRAAAIGRPVTHEIRPPSMDAMAERIGVMRPAPVALQASWDGDTNGWIVFLDAVVEEGGHHRVVGLGSMRGAGGDMRLFDGEVPPWPEAIWAARAGEELARRFGLPFHFGSPDQPDDAPDWWDV